MAKNLDLLEKEGIAQDLLPAIQEGKTEPLERFFEIFSDDIYNFSIRYYNFDDDEAGDYFLYAFEHLRDGRKIKSFRNKSKFTTWFFSVLRNMLIDFLRSRKNKIYTTSFARTDSEGNVIDSLETIPDSHGTNDGETEFLDKFRSGLNELKISHRILLKLAYAHYLDITKTELDWLVNKSGKTADNVLSIVSTLKEIGHKKSSEVRDIEDKLTANYQAISLIENRINSFFIDNPEIKAERKIWNEDYDHKDIPPETIDFIRRLSKKKRKHSNLLKNQEKSMLTTRVPYKKLVPLLGSSEGVLSVQLLRVVEKLGQDFIK
ncbi:MAG: sigma-70 family RNA polymerase sigma factor [Leptospirales bacterium]